jgi:hypothetical protein
MGSVAARPAASRCVSAGSATKAWSASARTAGSADRTRMARREAGRSSATGMTTRQPVAMLGSGSVHGNTCRS